MLARIINLNTFVGDPWAVAGIQTPPPDDITRFVVTGPVLWRVIPYDGTGPSSSPVDDTTTLIDARLVVLGDGSAGTALLSACSGGPQPLGLQLRDRGLALGATIVFGIPTITIGSGTAALWIYADAGVLEVP